MSVRFQILGFTHGECAGLCQKSGASSPLLEGTGFDRQRSSRSHLSHRLVCAGSSPWKSLNRL